MDVLEHIQSSDEDAFMFQNLIGTLLPDGVCIIGTPSLVPGLRFKIQQDGSCELQVSGRIKDFRRKFFQNVFMFSMNDEVVHTGYGKMAHYNIALCCGKR